MGRSDRLYALVEELRARAPRVVSRHELAERLEVSARTVERDILTLQQAGVPIWTQRGRFGGYAIEHATTLPPLNLDATEAVAVMAALSVLPNHPFAAAGRRAQQKLLAAMRRADVAQAQELATRIRTASPEGPGPDSEVVRNIERAVVGRRVVDLVYGDRKGSGTSRTVEAHGLHLTSRAGYLIGWCRLRDAGRAFRLDRIEKALVRDEVAPERDIEPMLDWVEGALTLDTAGPPTPPSRTAATSHGRPRWLEREEPDRAALATATEPTAVLVRSLLGHLPGVEEHDHHGRPAWRLQGHDSAFAAAQDDGRLWVDATPGEIAARTSASPDIYTRHYGLSIRLDRVDGAELRRLVLTSYRLARMRTEQQGCSTRDVTEVAPQVAANAVDADGITLRLPLDSRQGKALALADPVAFRDDGDDLLVDLSAIDRDRLVALLRLLDDDQGSPC